MVVVTGDMVLEVVRGGTPLRCMDFGKSCGLVLEYDGEGFYYRGSSRYLNIDEIQLDGEWSNIL